MLKNELTDPAWISARTGGPGAPAILQVAGRCCPEIISIRQNCVEFAENIFNRKDFCCVNLRFCRGKQDVIVGGAACACCATESIITRMNT